MVDFKRLDWFLITVAIGSSLLGIIILYGGGSSGESLALKNLVWLFIGIIIMFIFAFINYQTIGSYTPIIYAIALLLLIFTLMPFIGTKVKGARSWIRFFGFGFQPAEIMKLALVIVLSKYLTFRENEIEKFKELFIPFIITIFPILLIVAQPDLGYALLLLPVLMLLLFIGGANVSILIGLSLIGFIAIFVPMYIEYHKYILNDEIYLALRDDHFRIADAIKILNFEIWSYLDSPKTFISKNSSTYIDWAVKTLAKPENLKILNQTVALVKKSNPIFLRDFFANNIALIITFTVSSLGYITSFFLYFLTRKSKFKSLSSFLLIIALAFAATFSFQKFIKLKPHQVIRVVSFANPEKFRKGAGYQLRHSLITLGSGQATGKGWSKGDMTKGKVPFLPEWYNDFIFSVIGEQFGFVGTLLTLFFMFGLVIRGAFIALQSKDYFGSLLAAGITALFFLHFVINIGINLGLVPVTGLPLPFVSHGGSSMILNFVALGILLNINLRRFINA